MDSGSPARTYEMTMNATQEPVLSADITHMARKNEF